MNDDCPVIQFVTGNPKKLREITAILEEYGLPLPMTPRDLDLDELQSDRAEKISAAKCALAADITGGPVLVDDTGLSLYSLGGMPGAFIKWFYSNDQPPDTLARMLEGFDDKRAYAQSCIAFSIGPNTVPVVFVGRCEGTIVYPREMIAQDDTVTGWDACFLPDEGNNLTFAEMNLEQKNRISHRAKALKQLSNYLYQHEDILSQLCLDHLAAPNPDRQSDDKFRFHRRRAAI